MNIIGKMYNTISNKKSVFVANSIQSIWIRNNIKTCLYDNVYKNRRRVSFLEIISQRHFTSLRVSESLTRGSFWNFAYSTIKEHYYLATWLYLDM